jgi:uncharacterized protein YndB with AHSA1/START domain
MSFTRLQFEALIQASPQRVWEVMLSDATYRQWTSAFMPGSYFEGRWEQGSTMRFLGPDESGQLMGIQSRIAELRLHEYVGIEHMASIRNGVVDASVVPEQSWAGARENYRLSARHGATHLGIETDTLPEYEAYMSEAWPKALDILQRLC